MGIDHKRSEKVISDSFKAGREAPLNLSTADRPDVITSNLIKVSLMRKFARTSMIMLSAAALLGTMALPASAADTKSATNDATVTIEAGFLVLDTTAATLTLAHTGASAKVSTATGTLTGVNVSDLNGDGLGWASSVSLNGLKFGEEIITLADATYVNAMTAQTGTVTTGGAAGTITAPAGGNSDVTFDTTVTVQVPNTVKTGTYTGTLTHSLL